MDMTQTIPTLTAREMATLARFHRAWAHTEWHLVGRTMGYFAAPHEIPQLEMLGLIEEISVRTDYGSQARYRITDHALALWPQLSEAA